MSGEDTWQIVLYRDARGQSPVMEFIRTLDKATQQRILSAIEQLRQENQRATFPLVRKIEGKIWEMRIESGPNTYRVFYFFFTGKQIVLAHAFQKKTQKTPQREIETARQRYDEFLRRAKGDT